MDLLKGITQGLRGRDETRRDEPSRTVASSQRDADRSAATSSTGDSTTQNSDASPGDQSDNDEHVCSFCETEFEPDRGTCPECGAEIVIRGKR